MLYAKFMYPENGYDVDIEEAERYGLEIGKKYEVEYLSMGGFHTSIFLKNINGVFNSVQFDFFEDEQEVDIYRNPKYSGYY